MKEVIMSLGIILVIVVVIVIKVIQSIKDQKIADTYVEESDKYKEREYKSMPVPTKVSGEQVRFSNEVTVQAYKWDVVVDEENGILKLSNSLFQKDITVNFRDIIGVDLSIDDTKALSAGNIIGGAILAGGVGAIIGAMNKKDAIKNITVNIYTNSISNSLVQVTCLDIKVKTNDILCRNAKNFADRLYATVKAIVNQNNTQSNTSGIQQVI